MKPRLLVSSLPCFAIAISAAAADSYIHRKDQRWTENDIANIERAVEHKDRPKDDKGRVKWMLMRTSCETVQLQKVTPTGLEPVLPA